MRVPLCQYRRAAILGVCLSLAFAEHSHAGDILRGGASSGVAPKGGTSGRAPGVNAAADIARTNARDALARTTQAVQSVKAMQAAARAAAIKGPNHLGFNPNAPTVRLPDVPDGLRAGGLKVSPQVAIDPSLWRGAELPKESVQGDRTRVTIKQTQQQAVLNWETFNIGKKTTLKFDQSAGKADQGKWTAFNKVEDPSGVPSQILGAIEAPGHVYVINRNGILFGGSSQVNTRALVASSLPINDNLIRQGLLNNPNAEFLFATPRVSDPAFALGGATSYTLADTLLDGTTPTVAAATSGGVPVNLRSGSDFTIAKNDAGRSVIHFTEAGLAKVGAGAVTVTYFNRQGGDVIVQPGARLQARASGDGNGGRIMLVGANVRNEGTIAAPAGQVIAAAGLQVGVSAHASSDPSLRGLDVFVGAAGTDSGKATNSGLIEVSEGSASMSGRRVLQLGVIDSTTSVSLNGRIDLFASYGAVSNPNHDVSGPPGAGGPQFLFQHTGVVTLGTQSVTRILPDYASGDAVPGTALPEKSQINIEGQAIHFAGKATMLAPNADVSIRAGTWPYKDVDGNLSVLGSAQAGDPGLSSLYSGTRQRFLHSGGQIYFDPGALLSVAGSTDVFVPLAHSILDVEFRGAEIADSPLQREGVLRGTPLTLDIRNTGINAGRYWMGTPLGDATGLAGLIQRNAAQLTAEGGHVSLRAGSSIVVREGATIDVSGGFLRHEAGMVTTSRLLLDGRIVDIKNALPGIAYDGIYDGTFTRTHARWGIAETFTAPFSGGARYQESYLQGANGGTLTMVAPSMALDGTLRGLALQEPRPNSFTTAHSSLSIGFSAEKLSIKSESDYAILAHSPTPPDLIFTRDAEQRAPEAFTLAGETSAELRADRVATVKLSPELLEEHGFGHLTVDNADGNVVVAGDASVTTRPRGSISMAGANVTVRSDLRAPGGDLHFTAYNYSPAFAADFTRNQSGDTPRPAAAPGRGLFTLTPGASLDAAGLVVDDRNGSNDPFTKPLALAGGRITIDSYSAHLANGSAIDVSGGVAVSGRGAITYGAGGSIAIRAGQNPGFGPVLGGELVLGSTLSGYSGGTGGTLAVQSGLVQIGGSATFPRTLLLQPEFFRQGGFTSYALTGIGAASASPIETGGPETYAPAILLSSGINIQPVAEQWIAVPHAEGGGGVDLERRLAPRGVRKSVSLAFLAVGADDLATPAALEVRGDLRMERGAKITTDPGASVSFQGDTVTLLGDVSAPGGAIVIQGGSSFRLAPAEVLNETFARPTVHLGAEATLSVAGTAVFTPDVFGRRIGTLLPGGSISVSGNLIAQAGAVLDASGASATFDLAPGRVGAVDAPSVPANSGLTAPLFTLSTVETRLDSDGGRIDLHGSQMLFSDATLRGHAGGETAIGATLSIFSGRYYLPDAAKTGADINLVVTQSGNSLAPANANPRVGFAVLDGAGAAMPGMGYFAADRFARGGFDSLDLGFKVIETNPRYGGNLEFRGPVSITAPGALRIAAGGVVQANAAVTLRSDYFAIGQPFRAPLNPLDTTEVFTQSGDTRDYFLTPTFGPGRLTVHADLIDLGTVSLQNIGRASFVADGGDIRGNGTVNIAGDLTLRAAQIYPTTLSTLSLFAFDHDGVAGSVTIAGSGRAAAPLSAGGTLRIFASEITQGGTLRAPLGSIVLGWDGTDFDLSDADLDAPSNPVSGTTATVPTTKQVTLADGSLTSVSAAGLLIPFGLSPDGSTWIDPRGVNVTLSGLPEKRVTIAGDRVTTARGSRVDLRGGGELAAFRWVSGAGGSIDLLGTATAEWQSSTAYSPGDLVTSGGRTWSARVRHSAQQPSSSLYWTLVPESFAIVPGFTGAAAPYAPFNTGANAADLGGDPGFISSGLHIGDQIYLQNVPGLGSGHYTLLPRRYALMPGAFLVTPQTADAIGTVSLPDGSSIVSGATFNAFSQPGTLSAARTRFEIASGEVLRQRAAYDELGGNAFFTAAAQRFEVASPQELPRDAGYAGLHGGAALNLAGAITSAAAQGGRGAAIDLSSFAEMHVIGGSGAAPADAKVVLNAGVLNSWGAESLVVGGLRRVNGTGTTLEVRTSSLVLDNAGAALVGPDIALVSKSALTLDAGAVLTAKGRATGAAETYQIAGDGALARVSVSGGGILRTGVTAAVTPRLTIGADASVAGANVVLDSTYGTAIDATAGLAADSLALGSGQISILLEPQSGPLAGAVVDPQLTIGGEFLASVQQVEALTLRSYRTIDVYGQGTFGSPQLERLELLGGGLRGFGQGDGAATFDAGNVLFSNPSGVAALAAPSGTSGQLQVDASVVRFGVNAFAVTGYTDTVLNATGGLLAQGAGTFSFGQNLTVHAPRIAGERSANLAISAGGELVLAESAGAAAVQAGLGARFAFTGASVLASTPIAAPSGQIALRARTGDVIVGGSLDAAGTMQKFFDLTRYSDGGAISLVADAGRVELLAGSRVSVAGAAGGGNAGAISVSAAQGNFDLNASAQLLGAAATGETTGSFVLDARALDSFEDLSVALNAGGFFEQRHFRVRTGDVVVSNPGGLANKARDFSLSADTGDIRVTGTIDASGDTGGSITLVSGGSLTVESGALLTAHAKDFNNAGKGGAIHLEAGAAINGIANLAATLDIQSGAKIDLGVDAFQAGAYTDPNSSAFRGQFTGTLHLRAPRAGNDLNITATGAEIAGATSVLVEGFRVYDRSAVAAASQLNTAFLNTVHSDATAFINAADAAIRARLPSAVSDVLVVAPGIEIFSTGNLQLGQTADNAANDWNLAGLRYGADRAPGVLTLRAGGNLVFLNALSDGFDNAPGGTPVGQQLWLSRLMDLNPDLPINTQSWSFRLAAGADLAAADFSQVQSLTSLAADTGSLLLGKFYTPTFGASGNANLLTSTIINHRYQVIRTGAGEIEIAAGRDVQLRNQFASIYTAGVRLPDPTRVFADGDFSVPIVDLPNDVHPVQGNALGANQQRYSAQYSMAGGDVMVAAGANIGRYTQLGGVVTPDSTAQLPTNWLYRRGSVDDSGVFGLTGSIDPGDVRTVDDPSGSTTWWIDFSNFFQGFGALGGGNIALVAGRDVVNADAVAPTNARMAGLDAGVPIAPDADKLLELGGGDITIRAGSNIDGGIYYVERGAGTLKAGGEITTNSARTPWRGILTPTPEVLNPLTWMPTTLFLGKGGWDVSALGDVLLGPVANPFLLPQGLNNKFWYKTYWNSYAPDSEVAVSSFGGDVTHRLAVTVPVAGQSPSPMLTAWMDRKHRLQNNSAAFLQPWLRVVETNVTTPFETAASLMPPTLRSTAFGGDVNIAGDLTLAPAERGTLELAAAGAVIGLQPTGVRPAGVPAQTTTVWTTSTINVSDADPGAIPAITTPFAYQSLVGRDQSDLRTTSAEVLAELDRHFAETGSYSGNAGSFETKQALHDADILHRGDTEPLRLYAGGGDLTGITLFAPKATRVLAANDITDVSFYIQNVAAEDVSVVSAGRDIVPYNENAPLRTFANDFSLGNLIGESPRGTVTGNTLALAGDLHISGPGVLEVLAGRNLDLGTGSNFVDGTGVGLVSIGNFRNPFLPFEGADLIAMAGVGAPGGGAAIGLSGSTLDFDAFRAPPPDFHSAYLTRLGLDPSDALTPEQRAILGLEMFYRTLRDTGRDFVTTGSYTMGEAAIASLFGDTLGDGEIFSRARDIRTATGGNLLLAAPGGGITMASDIFGNPLTPPGIVTEFGGAVSIATGQSVDIGQARIFTLRGGDIVIWSSQGDIAAGNAPRTVVTAPPTRVVIDVTSADVQTDLGGLATGGGIGVLASVEGVPPGDVDLIAPNGIVDAGDAGIRVTGNINIAATAVLNASNIQVGGTSGGVPSAPSVAAPSLGGLSAASNAAAAGSNTAREVGQQQRPVEQQEELPSIISVEVLGFGDGTTPSDDEEEKKRRRSEPSAPIQA